MATRQRREEDARHVIQPFIDDWAGRTENEWEAFRNFAVGQVLWDEGLTDEQIEEATAMDASGDMGIDAWWLAADESGAKLYLIQSKDKRATKEDLTKLREGFISVMDPSKAYMANRALQERAAELRDRIAPGLAIEFHLVSSQLVQRNLKTDGESLDDGHIEIEGTRYAFSSFVHDVESLAQSLRVIDTQPIEADFTVSNDGHFVLEPKNAAKTVSAAISASELALLYSKNRTNLFRENPRYYLGMRNSVNDEMYETLRTEPANFYLYNNGLTATCSGVTVEGNGDERQLRIRDFQIVNGCQTTVTIHEIWRKGILGDKLKEVLVPIRIIETQQTAHTAKFVATRTNRQTAMKSEDFHSGDTVHENLHAQFDRLSPRWYYEHKRGTWNTDMSGSRARAPYRGGEFGLRVIKMKDLAQACLAFRNLPHIAGDRVREYFRSDELHANLFPEFATAHQLLLPFVLFSKVSLLVRDVQREAADRGEPYSWSLQYIRFPIVANVAQLLRYLLGIEGEEYFGVLESQRLVESMSEWDSDIMNLVIPQVVEYFDGQAKQGHAVRSLVRQGEWLTDVFDLVRREANRQLDVEARFARQQSVDAETVGLRSVLPIVLPSPSS